MHFLHTMHKGLCPWPI